MTDYFISPDILLYVFDMMGIVACAVAGTLLAQHKGFDIFGCVLVAMVNAIAAARCGILHLTVTHYFG